MTQIDDKRFHAAIIQVLDAAEAIKMSLKDQGLSYDAKAKKIISRPRYTFKAGEWVVFVDIDGTKSVLQIKDFIYNTYEFTDGSTCDKSAEQFMRPWTIADAGSGDVLSWDNSKCIALFKNIYDKDSFKSHGFVGHCTGTFESKSYHDIKGVHPATKEQRDTLFKSMHDAGYEWDADKKELKRIKPEPLWIKADNWYMCIDSPFSSFVNGKLYRSDRANYIENENKMDCFFDPEEAAKHFRPATPEEVLKAKHGITGINSKNADGKLGEMISQRMTSAKAKEVLLNDGLTEFEQSVRDIITSELCNNFGDVSFGVSISNDEAKLIAKKLLKFARKQIASEINKKQMVIDFLNGLIGKPTKTPVDYYSQGITETINALEEG